MIGRVLAAALCVAATGAQADGFRPVQKLLDLSGLAWMGGDLFLAVHDAKVPKEAGFGRVSLLKSPASLEGVLWKPLPLAFPGGESSDLESAARVPGRPLVVLAESGDDAGPHRRLFLARVADDAAEIVAETVWDGFHQVYNVEATAAVEADGRLLFLWAERASGKRGTAVGWAEMTLDPFAIGPKLGETAFSLPAALDGADATPRYSRPIVGLDADASGALYAVAAYDPEGTVPDADDGPFRSAVLRIGRATAAGVELSAPEVVATLDGFKTESVAVVQAGDGLPRLFVGTDDENWGGTLRPLP